MNKKKVILTFDYELSLGKDSGTCKKCIIEPTNIILDLFDKYNGCGLFFVDATYLMTLKKYKHNDFDIVKAQIERIIKSGSDVGLHIHPQWIDAEPVGNDRWTFTSFEHYRIHSLDDNGILKLFSDSMEVLNKIVKNADKKYKIASFRAGGWSLQPFSRVKKAMLENGIKFDFSVVPGKYKEQLPLHYFDFRKAFKNKCIWRFSDDPLIADDNGAFYEVPLTMVKMSNLDSWLNYYIYKKNEKNPSDEKGGSIAANKRSLFGKILRLALLLKNDSSPLAFDGLSNKYFLKALNRASKKELEFLTAVCHPKSFAKSSIKNLEYMLKNCETISLEDLL